MEKRYSYKSEFMLKSVNPVDDKIIELIQKNIMSCAEMIEEFNLVGLELDSSETSATRGLLREKTGVIYYTYRFSLCEVLVASGKISSGVLEGIRQGYIFDERIKEEYLKIGTIVVFSDCEVHE